MEIGLDFDGVISNCQDLKSYWVRRMYGIEIPPERLKRRLIARTGNLTLEQYENIQQKIYGTREIGLTMPSVEGSLKFIPRLQEDGHNLKIVTSRIGPSIEVAKEWLEKKGLDLEIVGVRKDVSKAEAYEGLDVYMDDDLAKLEPLIEVVPHRYLFSVGPNLNVDLKGIAERIESWEDFYGKIKSLT